MKIYTKTGDNGETSLFGGKRVLKNDLRVEAYGTIDELMAQLGLLGDATQCEQYFPMIKDIQDRLFTIGSYIAADPDKAGLKKPDLNAEDIAFLELKIDEFSEYLPVLKHFILPGGHPLVSQTHIARTICRRAERRVVQLNEEQSVEELIIQYLNRLSDFLFVFSRHLCQELGGEEIYWKPRV